MSWFLRKFAWVILIIFGYGLPVQVGFANALGETGKKKDTSDISALLQRMNDAFAQVAYDGVFSYFSGNELATLRVVHKLVDGAQRERLVHLNGAPREIVRHGDEVLCIVMPGDDLLSLEDSIPAGPFARAFVREFESLSNAYAVEAFGEGRIAGRQALRVAIKPKDRHRYGYRLWLDKETALLLRSELVDHEGNRLEIFQFASIVIGDAVQDDALESEDPQGSMVSHLRLESKTLEDVLAQASSQEPAADSAEMDDGWTTTWLPDGYRMADADVRRKPEHAVTNLIYSDGLAAFSIFIEPMPHRGAATMISQNGATVALNHRVMGGSMYYLVTLVGEIPVATAHQIIESVKRVDRPANQAGQ
ncbi:MAG: MucB/RseB C-terminal domain-containing protein [Pseudomonadota bacterium]